MLRTAEARDASLELHSEIGLRPFRGSDTICPCPTVVVTSGEVVGTSEEPASTVTFSLTLPSASRAVSEYSCATAMLMS